jgi:hypothetical protein
LSTATTCAKARVEACGWDAADWVVSVGLACAGLADGEDADTAAAGMPETVVGLLVGATAAPLESDVGSTWISQATMVEDRRSKSATRGQARFSSISPLLAQTAPAMGAPDAEAVTTGAVGSTGDILWADARFAKSRQSRAT